MGPFAQPEEVILEWGQLSHCSAISGGTEATKSPAKLHLVGISNLLPASRDQAGLLGPWHHLGKIVPNKTWGQLPVPSCLKTPFCIYKGAGGACCVPSEPCPTSQSVSQMLQVQENLKCVGLRPLFHPWIERVMQTD